MSELADYALELLSSSDFSPSRNSRLDGLLRDLADTLVDPDDPASEFDLPTLCALVDGALDEADAASATAAMRANPRKLRQYVELVAVAEAYGEDAPRESLEMHVAAEFEPPPASAPVIDLAERRKQRRLLGIAGSLAALLMVGLFLLVTAGPTLPGPLDAELNAPGRAVRSASWTIGETLELSAAVGAEAWWAVVAAAAPSEGMPARLWVARTSTSGSAEARVVHTEALTAPPGHRAYLVVASSEPLDALPALVTDWEAELRSRDDAGHLVRDFQALVDAEAGAHTWRVSEALPVTVVEDSL